jgi:hypothetical protein
MNIAKEFTIWKDHWYYRMIKRTRPWSIHTESLHKDTVWASAKKYVTSGKSAMWFVVTPANYDFVQTESGIEISKAQWEKLLLERYKWLQRRNQEIQIHVHLKIKMNLYPSSQKARADMKNKISRGVSWLRGNGFIVNKIVFGWWSYNQEAIDIATSYGLTTIDRLDYYFIHDYDLPSILSRI